MPGPRPFDARQHVDQDHLANQLGRHLGQGDGRESAERHSDDSFGVRGKVANGTGDVDGVAFRVQSPLGMLGPVRVSVSRQVQCHQWPVKGHGDGVPGVRILRTTVQEHQLGIALLPYERTQLAAGSHLNRDAPDDGRAVEGQAVFLGILVEQPELVVFDPIDHRCTTSPAAVLPQRILRRSSLPSEVCLSPIAEEREQFSIWFEGLRVTNETMGAHTK